MNKNKRDDENIKNIVIEKFEIEKNKILKDYAKFLNDIDIEERIKQKEDLENFIKNQELKFEHEKDVHY